MTQRMHDIGKPNLPAWRSLLYVPVVNEKFVNTAHTRGADAIILDLEDSIALSRKDEARTLVAAAAAKVAQNGADVLVRINSPWRMAICDLEAVVMSKVSGLVLTKVASAQHVQIVSEVVAELEAERGMPIGSTQFVVLIETAAACLRMEEIAHADPRIVAMTLGTEDFAASCGMQPDDDALYVPKMQMLIHARAAGILPLGFIHTVVDYKDLDGLRAAAMRARRLGFVGAAIVHPAQVAIVNEAYSPGADEVERATRIMEATRTAAAAGTGAYEVDGKMVDAPVVERARTLLERHEAITQRLKKTS